MPDRRPPHTSIPVDLPGEERGPLRRIGARVALAVALVCLVAAVTYLGRGGYVDPEDASISLLDAFYYATVSITTTGYGDIRPVSDDARLLTTVLVTPARVLFLVLLVGTTLEILAERGRAAYRRARWRMKLHDHIIVCGYGTKGQSAVRVLCGRGVDRDRIVVIDEKEAPRRLAVAEGFAAIAGSASSRHVLEQARIGEASAVVVAVDRDDAAVLVTLTAREMAPKITISAAAREEENVHLLHQSGADTVITSSGAAGRLLGLSTDSPNVSDVIEDLLSVGEGLDIVERAIGPEEAGPVTDLAKPGRLVVAVIRGGEVIRFDDERARELRPGDRVVALQGA